MIYRWKTQPGSALGKLPCCRNRHVCNELIARDCCPGRSLRTLLFVLRAPRRCGEHFARECEAWHRHLGHDSFERARATYPHNLALKHVAETSVGAHYPTPLRSSGGLAAPDAKLRAPQAGLSNRPPRPTLALGRVADSLRKTDSVQLRACGFAVHALTGSCRLG